MTSNLRPSLLSRQHFETTDRRVAGPDSDLIELRSAHGHIYTGIRFHEQHRSHPDLNESLGLIRGFLESPMVHGLIELDSIHPEHSAFLYPTGPAWSAHELLRWLPRRKSIPFTRAGLELCYATALILIEAHEMGAAEGIYCHGGLTPWRLLLDREANVQVIGYGLPQISALKYAHEGPTPPTDATRYTPPERLTGHEEDLSTDLFSLALITSEWVTGRPLYQGRPSDVLNQALRATGLERLHRNSDELPIDLVQVLGRALRPDRDARFASASRFIDSILELLNSPISEGPSLVELVQSSIQKLQRCQLLVPAGEPPTTKDPLPIPAPVERPHLEVVTSTQTLPSRESSNTQMDGLDLTNGTRDRLALFPRYPIRGNPVRYLVRRGTATPTWANLDPKECLAVSAARLVDMLCPTPLDLTGQLTCWYRITQNGVSWYGDTLTQVLDPKEPATLQPVVNRTSVIRFQLEGVPNAQLLETPVGTACHIHFILSTLKNRYRLHELDWGLWVNGQELSPWQILDDYAPGPGLKIVLRRRQMFSVDRSE